MPVRIRLRLPVMGLVFLLCAPGLLFAQFSTAQVNRPSEQSGSTRVGLTGGRYTRSLGGASSLGLGTSSARESSIFSVDTNYYGLAQRRNLPSAPLPAAFTFTSLGYLPKEMPPSRFSFLSGQPQQGAASASMKNLAESFNVGIAGIGSTMPRLPVRPALQGPPHGDTAFQTFFALSPKTEEGPKIGTEIPPDGLTGILERQTNRLAELKLAAALEAFKRATSRDVEQPVEAFWRAHELLVAARDLNRDSYVAPLLLVHTSLAKRQVETAMGNLVLAVRRNPNMFVDGEDVSVYFGDPASLDEQLRPFLRIGDENPDMTAAWALQAYCAWALKDATRLQAALDQMQNVEKTETSTEGSDADIVRYALSATLP